MAPTLLEKGKLRAIAGSSFKETQKKLDEYERAIDYVFEKLTQMVRNKERTLILISETGSGKSTALMAYLFQEHEKIFPESKGKYIIVTQPKVLTTKSIPQDIVSKPFYSFLEMGKTIGFTTGALKNPSQRGGLLYSTVGVLSVQMTYQDDAFIRDRYGFIIIDEAHDQSQEMTVLLYMLKKFLERNKGRPDCPVVVFMSATLDMQQFGRYFNTNNFIKVTGSSYAKESLFPTTGYPNYIRAAADKVLEINRNNPNDPPNKCDILVFLPGVSQMRDVRELIEAEDEKKELAIFQLTGPKINAGDAEVRYSTEMSLEEVRRILKRPNIKRRVSLATDTAETGLTIDTLKYVIDSGWALKPEYNPIHDVRLLVTKAINNNSMVQRKGRVGRQFPGIYIPLYTEKTFNEVPKKAISPIYTQNIDSLLLNIFDYQLNKYPNKEPSIPETYDPIGNESFIRSIDKLRILGILELDSYRLTRMGEVCNRLGRLEVETRKVVVSSYMFGISLEDIVSVAIFFNIERNKILDRKFRFNDVLKELGIEMNLFYFKMILADQFIQWWFIVKLYQKYVKSLKFSKIEKKFEELGIKFDSFIMTLSKKRDALDEMRNFGFIDFYEPLDVKQFENDLTNTVARFKGCFYEGYKLNYAVWSEEKQKYITRTGLQIDKPYFDLGRETTPKSFIYDNILIRSSPRSNVYDYKAEISQFSVLDGYIAICAPCDQ